MSEHNLSPRQRQVLQMVASDMSNKAIAKELGISVNTVEVHIARAAARIPCDGRPRFKAMVFYLTMDGDDEAA